MIEVLNLGYQYELEKGRLIPALKGVNLTIEEGESVSIMGPNGSGKTTLARCLNGLLRPTSGEVIVDGLRLPDSIWAIRRKVGMVFQNPDNQIVSATVEREIAFGLENLGIPSEEIRERVGDALRRFHLWDYRHHPPHRLSGGEKQRVAIAAVLAMEPKYLVLDEPTSLLDPKGRREVLSLLSQLQSHGGVSVIHITQFPEEAAEADRVILLVDGQVVMDDAPQVVFAAGERLRGWGVQVPVLVELVEGLSREGLEVGNGVLSVAHLVETLANWRDDGQHSSVAAFERDGKRGKPRPFSTFGGLQDKITTEGLSHVYDQGLPTEKRAISEIGLHIHPGEFLGLIGPTGSGKTTLVQHLNGLLQPTGGRVLVDGIDLRGKGVDLQQVRQKVGLAFQFPEVQLFEPTVYDDVAFGPRNLGLTDDEIDGRVRGALELVKLGFEDFAGRSPLNLSQGEKRRVAIAGVLALRPEVLVLDEPTAGLDPKGVEQVATILHKLHGQGTIIILISHDTDLVARLADRIVVLNGGQVVVEGSPEGVFRGVDSLKKMGLDVPQVTDVVLRLKELGWGVRLDIFTVEEVKSEILKNRKKA